MQQPKTDEANQPKVLDAKEVWIEVFNHLEMKLPEEEDYIKKRFRTEWHNIRIFVSSTFKDFKYEREVLVKQVTNTATSNLLTNPHSRDVCSLVVVIRLLFVVCCSGVPRSPTLVSTTTFEADRRGSQMGICYYFAPGSITT